MNGKFRNANIGELHLTNTVDILETDNLCSNSWGRRTNLLFTENSLPNLQWQDEHQCSEKLCTPQSAEVGVEPRSSRKLPGKSLMFRMLINCQNQLKQGFI